MLTQDRRRANRRDPLAQNMHRRAGRIDAGCPSDFLRTEGTAHDHLRALRPPACRRSRRFQAPLRAKAMVTPSAGWSHSHREQYTLAWFESHRAEKFSLVKAEFTRDSASDTCIDPIAFINACEETTISTNASTVSGGTRDEIRLHQSRILAGQGLRSCETIRSHSPTTARRSR
jgi:hypothetical protein